MITKSRLEELIKQGATIWSRYTDLIKEEPILINLSSLNQENARFKLYNDKHGLEIYDYDNLLMYQLEDLYETEKDAKWALKYQRIPRTEYLDLPMWEDFCKHKYVSFNDEFCNHYELELNKNSKLVITKYPADWEIFYEPATEENYIKACNVALKLFKGEE